MHKLQYRITGQPLKAGTKVLVILPDKGASFSETIFLADLLEVQDFTLIVPEPANNSWLPYSILSPVSRNEPWLSSSMKVLEELIEMIHESGVSDEMIYFTGISQGACIAAEFTAKQGRQFGGLAAFAGGLIGNTVMPENYSGNLQKMPVFFSSGIEDKNVPANRIKLSAEIFSGMNASVEVNFYERVSKENTQNEIALANKILFSGKEKTKKGRKK